MKRNVLIAVALFATIAVNAQNIAVVNQRNETTVYQTLDEAVTGADPGSIIYLPGGGVQIKDETKITKKLTIMGVSHRGDTDNADGATVIAGNLNFHKGSSGSSVIGAYISGNINVGTATDSVTNLTVRFCNVGSIQVNHSQSSGMVVNQCYLRNTSNFSNCNVCLENTILHSATYISGGKINHNIITNSYTYNSHYGNHAALYNVNNSSITNNILLLDLGTWGGYLSGSSNFVSNNGCKTDWSNCEECVKLDEGKDWDDVFLKYDNKNKITISSNYNLKGDWGKDKATDGTDIGIYGGSGFKDKDDAHAPIPRIISKKVDEQTDGSGKLHIEVTIKAK